MLKFEKKSVAKKFKYSECVSVQLIIQHAKQVRRIVTCGLSDAIIFFHIVLYTVRFGGGGGVEHKMWVLIFSTLLTETLLILRIIRRDIITNVHRSSRKVSVLRKKIFKFKISLKKNPLQ